jgi:uncharacterized protein (TIGR00255 family)
MCLEREAAAMIKSMTGYGRGEATGAGTSVTAELRSVNHRYCEIVVRLPRSLVAIEDTLKRSIQQTCARGRIELGVALGGGKEAKTLSLDRALARQYHGLLRTMQKEPRLSGSVDVALVAAFRDIVSIVDRPVDERRLAQAVKRATASALAALDDMRSREGAALAGDLKQRMESVRTHVASIADRAPVVVRDHFDRMKTRVEKLIGSADLDAARLQQELALFADRCDISEELTRLRSHLDQFEHAMTSRDPVGRTLDFLLQEIGREVNTMGSKGNDTEVARHVVALKSELEKIREQVQNIE